VFTLVFTHKLPSNKIFTMAFIEDVGTVYVITVMVALFVILILTFWMCRKGVVEPPEEIYIIEDDNSSEIVVVDGYMIDFITDGDTCPSTPSSTDLNGENKTYPLDNLSIVV